VTAASTSAPNTPSTLLSDVQVLRGKGRELPTEAEIFLEAMRDFKFVCIVEDDDSPLASLLNGKTHVSSFHVEKGNETLRFVVICGTFTQSILPILFGQLSTLPWTLATFLHYSRTIALFVTLPLIFDSMSTPLSCLFACPSFRPLL
jgi:hypothetical protein